MMPSPALSVTNLIALADSSSAGIAEIELGVTESLETCEIGSASKAIEINKTNFGLFTTNAPNFWNCSEANLGFVPSRPKKDKRAGCKVSAATIATKGTIVPAIPSDLIKGTGTQIKVESAMATVEPEIKMVRWVFLISPSNLYRCTIKSE